MKSEIEVAMYQTMKPHVERLRVEWAHAMYNCHQAWRQDAPKAYADNRLWLAQTEKLRDEIVWTNLMMKDLWNTLHEWNPELAESTWFIIFRNSIDEYDEYFNYVPPVIK